MGPTQRPGPFSHGSRGPRVPSPTPGFSRLLSSPLLCARATCSTDCPAGETCSRRRRRPIPPRCCRCRCRCRSASRRAAGAGARRHGRGGARGALAAAARRRREQAAAAVQPGLSVGPPPLPESAAAGWASGRFSVSFLFVLIVI